ncbi:MAG TPA: O-antigen ligase family protein [Verrucomicrobiae bacterium]|nr:O-antigen ligase family protein [Verrucomicrobiae bacterium]
MIPLLLLAGVFLVSFLHPRRGVMLIALTAAFWLEWQLPVGVRLSVFEVAIMGGLCGVAAGNDGLRFARNVPLSGRVGAFALATVVSFLYTHIVAFTVSLTFDAVLWATFKPTLYVVSFFLFYAVLDNPESLQQALRLYLLSATVSAIIGLVQVATHRTLLSWFVGTYPDIVEDQLAAAGGYDGTRAFSTLGHPTVFGHFMVIPLSIGLACLLASEQWRRKRMAWVAAILLALALMASGTRAAWIAFALSFGMLSWRLRLFRHRLFLPLLLGGIVAFAGAYKLNLLPQTFENRLERMKHAETDDAMTPRYQRWAYFWNRSMQAPWFGHGIVADAAAFEALEYAVSPHNTYIELAVQRGWLATGIFAAIVLGFWGCAWGLAGSPEDGIRGLGVGLFAGIVGSYTLGAMFDPLYEDSQSTIVFWLLLAIAARYSRLGSLCLEQETIAPEVQEQPEVAGQVPA